MTSSHISALLGASVDWSRHDQKCRHTKGRVVARIGMALGRVNTGIVLNNNTIIRINSSTIIFTP